MGNIVKTKANIVEIVSADISGTEIYAKFIPPAPTTGIIISKISGADYTNAAFCCSDNIDDFSVSNYIPIELGLTVDTAYIRDTIYPAYGILFIVAAPAVYQVEYSY